MARKQSRSRFLYSVLADAPVYEFAESDVAGDEVVRKD
jgi:hypothetical protein